MTNRRVASRWSFLAPLSFPKSRSAGAKKRRLALEQLETRANPAVLIQVTEGTISGRSVFNLGITGDDAANNITLSLTTDGFVRHNLALGGDLVSNIDLDSTLAGVQSYKMFDLNTVRIAGRGGDDYIDVQSLAMRPPLNPRPSGTINDKFATFVDGEDGNDTIIGSATSDLLTGGGGNDTMYGNGDDDALYGESFFLTGVPWGNDKLYGGAGNDLLFGDTASSANSAFGDGSNEIHGGDGDDYLDGSYGRNFFYGGAGVDTLVSTANTNLTLTNTQFFGNSGAITTNHFCEKAIFIGNSLANTLDATAFTLGTVQMWGQGGNDTLRGGSQADDLRGGDGDDLIYGNGGNDTLYGDLDGAQPFGYTSSGNDVIYGGAGNDTIYGDNPYVNSSIPGGGTGNDSLYGEAGDDFLEGAGGNDFLGGGDGNDSLSGNDGNDHMVGDAGNDLIDGSLGNDLLLGGVGVDTLRGGDGADVLSGGDQNDRLEGGAGDDILIGGAGADVLLAGAGSDVVIGGTTSYDANASQLNTLRDSWLIGLGTSFDAAITRITTGTIALTTTTVRNDFAIDDLTGNDPSEIAPGAADLFFSADQDILRDFQPNDRRRRVV